MLVHILHRAAVALLSLSSSALIFSETIPASPPTNFDDGGDHCFGGTRHSLTHVVDHPSTPWPSSASSFSRLVATKSTTTMTTTTTNDASALPLSSCWQYDTADDIPPSSYLTNEVILGRVVKVIDGDTIRIRHVPPCHHFFNGGEENRGCDGRRLTECTVIVRLYGVDAPEVAKKGRGIGQPYSREARDYVVDAAYGKLARVKLLGRDRYDRVIGRVMIGDPPSEEDLSEGLLERGYAALYVGGGARYDGRRHELEGKMAKARDEGCGIWMDGASESADPAAYKREMRARGGG